MHKHSHDSTAPRINCQEVIYLFRRKTFLFITSWNQYCLITWLFLFAVKKPRENLMVICNNWILCLENIFQIIRKKLVKNVCWWKFVKCLKTYANVCDYFNGYREPVKRFKWNSHDYTSVLKHNSNAIVKSECRGRERLQKGKLFKKLLKYFMWEQSTWTRNISWGEKSNSKNIKDNFQFSRLSGNDTVEGEKKQITKTIF